MLSKVRKRLSSIKRGSLSVKEKSKKSDSAGSGHSPSLAASTVFSENDYYKAIGHDEPSDVEDISVEEATSFRECISDVEEMMHEISGLQPEQITRADPSTDQLPVIDSQNFWLDSPKFYHNKHVPEQYSPDEYHLREETSKTNFLSNLTLATKAPSSSRSSRLSQNSWKQPNHSQPSACNSCSLNSQKKCSHCDKPDAGNLVEKPSVQNLLLHQNLPWQCYEQQPMQHPQLHPLCSLDPEVAQADQEDNAELHVGKVRSFGRSHVINDFKITCPLIDGEVVAAIFDSDGGILSSKYGDVKIVIPKGAICSGDLVKLYVATSLFGYDQFIFPELYDITTLVSSFCWIGGSYPFTKPISVEIEHFAVIDDQNQYCLFSCEDNTDSKMQPVNHDYSFELRDSKSVCVFQTTHFCSYCLQYSIDNEREAKDMRKIGAYAFQSEIEDSSDEIKSKICLCIPLAPCASRIKKLHKRKHMIFLGSKVFNVSFKKQKFRKYNFKLSHEDEVNGWHLASNKNDKIHATSVNFFNGRYGSAETLKEAEKDGLFPPSFALYIDPSGRTNDKLKTSLVVTSFKHKKQKQKQTFVLSINMHLCEAIAERRRYEPFGTSATPFVERLISTDKNTCKPSSQ